MESVNSTVDIHDWKGVKLMTVKKNRPRPLGMALVVGVILCLLGPATAAPAEKKGKGGVKPATAWVKNNSTLYAVRGDGQGPSTVYMDASIEGECVSVLADDPGSRRGFFQLRTVKNLDECNQHPERFLVLDLGDENDCDVDQDGDTGELESVYARFIAGQAFSRDAEQEGTSVVILILETDYSGTRPTTTQEAAWELSYSGNAQVDVDESDPNIRIITSQPGSSSADLCQIQLQLRGKKFKKVCEPCGSFDMPFEIHATRQPD
jgi:hypothetical protein